MFLAVNYWCHCWFSVFIIITDNRWEWTQQVCQLYQASGEQVKSWRVEATDKLEGWLCTIQKDVKRPKNKNRLTETSRNLSWIANSITGIYIFSSQTPCRKMLGLNREYLISSVTETQDHEYILTLHPVASAAALKQFSTFSVRTERSLIDGARK